jgi:hypothetical protein
MTAQKLESNQRETISTTIQQIEGGGIKSIRQKDWYKITAMSPWIIA